MEPYVMIDVATKQQMVKLEGTNEMVPLQTLKDLGWIWDDGHWMRYNAGGLLASQPGAPVMTVELYSCTQVRIHGKCMILGTPYNVVVDAAGFGRWRGGQHIQNALPAASREDREFLMTSISPQGWDDEVEVSDDEEDDDADGTD